MMRHLLDTDLSAYLDGEVARPARIESHLEACVDCTIRLTRLRKLSEQIHSLTCAEPHPSFAANVVGRIREENVQPIRRASSWIAFAGPLAAAALVLLVLYPSFVNRGGTPEAPTTNVADVSIPIAETMTLETEEIATPYAAKSDTSWMFAQEFRAASEPEVSENEGMIVAAASPEWFAASPELSLAMDDGRDFGTAISSMGADEQTAFLVLLSDYAREGR